MSCVYSSTYRLGLAPLPFVVFFGYEEIPVFRSGDAAEFIAGGLIACAGEVEAVLVVAGEHRGVVCPSGIEHRHAFHGVARAEPFHLRGALGSLQTALR